MKYAFFLGCKTPFHVPAYEVSTRAVCDALNVELVELEFTCCGYPMRNLYFESFLLSACRAMALAEKAGLDIMTQCKCCLGAFKTAAYYIHEDQSLWDHVNTKLAEEGLEYTGKAVANHLLTVLHNDVGIEVIKRKLVRPYRDMKVAVLHGCHALRPSQMTHFDDPWHPQISDDLVTVTGADVIDWPGKLSCCGAPLRGRNDELASSMIETRLSEAHEAGAEVFCVSCPYSHMQAMGAYESDAEPEALRIAGAALYPQLLGLAMGLSPEELDITDCSTGGAVLLKYAAQDAA